LIIEKLWKLLRDMPAEKAYKIVHSTPAWLSALISVIDNRTEYEAPIELLGYKLNNPVGLAAGLDKDGKLAWISWSLGLGFTVVGSVLPEPYEGSNIKILERLPDGALVNRLGLPSEGADNVVDRINRIKPPMPIALNVASLTREGYVKIVRKVCKVADWIEINISCPNTKEHTTFEQPEEAKRIISMITKTSCDKPLLLKIPSTRNDDRLAEYALIVKETGIAGIVAGNTRKIKWKGIEAGLSGTPLYETTLYMAKRLRELLPEDKIIVSVGGIDTSEKALRVLEYADAIEVLTVLLYYGPDRVRSIVRGIRKSLLKR